MIATIENPNTITDEELEKMFYKQEERLIESELAFDELLEKQVSLQDQIRDLVGEELFDKLSEDRECNNVLYFISEENIEILQDFLTEIEKAETITLEVLLNICDSIE